MHSKENDLTLDSWAESQAKYYKEAYNPELVKVLGIDDAVISGLKAKKLYLSVKLGDKV